MNAPTNPRKASYSGEDASVYQKQLDVRYGRAEAFLVEMAQWARLRRRIQGLESRWSINWLATGASSAGSITVAAVIAAIVLPSGKATGIGSAVAPVLWILAAPSAVLAVALIYLARLARAERVGIGSDIVDEMDTIEKAWEQRKQEGIA